MKYRYIPLLLSAVLLASNALAQTANPFSRLTAFDHPLKRYSPEQLTMVGTISQENNVWGIVKTPDNNVYTVKPGSQLGNSAYVVDVSSKKITVQQNSKMIELQLRQIK